MLERVNCRLGVTKGSDVSKRRFEMNEPSRMQIQIKHEEELDGKSCQLVEWVPALNDVFSSFGDS